MTTHVEAAPVPRSLPLSARLFGAASAAILRYGLVLFLVGGGVAKFTEAEAVTIQPWVAHSPFLGWLYTVTSVQGASIMIGVIELMLGALLAARHWWPRLSVLGSLGACIQFAMTFSFPVHYPRLVERYAGLPHEGPHPVRGRGLDRGRRARRRRAELTMTGKTRALRPMSRPSARPGRRRTRSRSYRLVQEALERARGPASRGQHVLPQRQGCRPACAHRWSRGLEVLLR
ncbi:MAG: DUF417 family protein [Chloroflexi bacterium]|nr:DUF417 family protein [Chloroflexota bacterium]